MLNESELKTLLEVAEKRIATERRNVPETTLTYTAYLNAADAFREKFTPATCAELVREVLRLREENEILRNADYSFLQKVEEQP